MAYNEVRARLLNSQSLLEDTNLVLFTINEKTLMQWYKNSTRCNEVKMLLQGLPHIPSQSTAKESLPQALRRPTSYPSPPNTPHTFYEAEDRMGLARVRLFHSSTSQKTTATFSSPTVISSGYLPFSMTPASNNLASTSPMMPETSSIVTVTTTMPETSSVVTTMPETSSVVTVTTSMPETSSVVTVTTSAPISRTTEWRHRKRAAESSQPGLKKARKEYSCKSCGQIIRGGM